MYDYSYRNRKFLEPNDILYWKGNFINKASDSLWFKPNEKYYVKSVTRNLTEFNAKLTRLNNSSKDFNLYGDFCAIHEYLEFTKDTKKSIYNRILNNKINLFLDIFKMEHNLKIDSGGHGHMNTEYSSYEFKNVLLCSKNSVDIDGKPIEGNVVAVDLHGKIRLDDPYRTKYLSNSNVYLYPDQVERYLRSLINIDNVGDWVLSENNHQWEFEYMYYLKKC